MRRSMCIPNMTYADLCRAIENGDIEATQDGEFFQLNRRDVVHIANILLLAPERHSAPTQRANAA